MPDLLPSQSEAMVAVAYVPPNDAVDRDDQERGVLLCWCPPRGGQPPVRVSARLDVTKKFRLSPEQVRTVVPGVGACYATDRITVDGCQVGYAYREEPDFPSDTGWRFFSGDESQEYVDDPSHTSIYDLNTIANYDPDIVSIVSAPAPVEFERQAAREPLSQVR